MRLHGMSAESLEALATKALQLAQDLRQAQPSYALAIEAGISDDSYRTVRFGCVAKYSGDVVVTMADGSRWRCVGHRPQGGPEWISKEGWIEFVPLSEEPLPTPARRGRDVSRLGAPRINIKGE